ncbi:MAG TPA: inorganic phosphate transporter, partial [Ilumatobacteraceae bacterium]
METAALVAVVAIALLFDFVNGFHDAANSIATVVATRVLQPWQAVIWAAFWNFIAFAVLPLKVANEIAKIIDPDVVSIGLVFAGLLGAIFWSVLTAWLGLPSSSSHALIGGMVGAGIAKDGAHVVNLAPLQKTAVFIVYSPLIGLFLGFVLIIGVMWLVHRRRNKRRVNRTFRSLQLVSAAAFSLGHGANDAQKTMGIIAALLVGANKLDPSVLTEPDSIPLWIVLSCHIAIALGTMFGGWRIVRTMGNK